MLKALSLPAAIVIAALMVAVAIILAALILMKRRRGAEAFASEVEFPYSEEGTPVEPSGVAVETETPLEIGTTVLAYSQESK